MIQNALMSETNAKRPALPWLGAIALLGFWIAVARMLSPQWSVYVQYNYGWAVPFLCAYLFWLRCADRPAVVMPKAAATILILTIAAVLLLPTRIVVEANPIWRAASWAMGVELVAITLCLIHLAGGRGWLKHFGFAVVFFLVAIPWPSLWESAIVQTLMRMNTEAVLEFLSTLGVVAMPHGNVIEISTGLVGIDEACSGIRSLQATLMMALFFGELFRLRTTRRVWLALAGVALALVCNMVRTFILVWVCHKSGMGTMNRWHDPTGIGILLGCFSGLWVIALKLRASASAAPSPAIPTEHGSARLPRFVPAALLVWLVCVEAGTAAWFGLREKTDSQLSNWSVRWPAGKANLREVELSRRVKEELKFKEGRGMGWSESDGTAWQVYYFRWGPATSLLERIHVQFAKTHRPEICLPATGLILRADIGVKDFSVGELTLPFRVYQFEDRGLPLHVFYCAWEDGTRGRAANMRENPGSRLAAARAGNRSISQRVLEIAVWGYETGEAEAALRSKLPEIIQYQ